MLKFRDHLAETAKTGPTVQYLKMISGMSKQPHVIANFIIKHGRKFEVNEETFLGKRGQQKLCFQNAGRIALFETGFTYVEGYVIFMGIPLEHAWLLDKKRNIRDTTLNNPDNITEYFGVPVKREFLQKVIYKTKTWGVFNWQNYEMFVDINPKEVVEKI